MSMTRKWSALTAVLVLGILVASWFLLVAPKRSDAAALESQRTQQEADNVTLQQHIKMLQAQQLDLPAQRAKLAEIRREIPDNPALPSMVRAMSKIARQSGVELVELSPSAPVLYVDPALAAVPAPVATTDPAASGSTGSGTATTPTDGSSAATTPTDGSSAATTSADGSTTGTTGAAPVAGAVGVTGPTTADSVLYQAPVKVTAEGSYFQLEQFLNRLEKLQRAFLVTGFTIDDAQSSLAQNESPGTLELALSTRMFISAGAPPKGAPATGATTAAPVPTVAPTTATAAQ
jgi:Tfp pilus assembly protein PilO